MRPPSVLMLCLVLVGALFIDPPARAATADLVAPTAVVDGVPIVPGRAAGSTGPGDGIKLLVRYQNSDELYAVHVNRRDGGMRIQRKHAGAYHALESTLPSGHASVYGRPQDVVVTVADQPDGSVEFRLEIDGRLRHRAIDRGQTPAGAPLRRGHVGVRADNSEFLLHHLAVFDAGADGSASGSARWRDDFDRPDGLITNQRVQSVPDHRWLVTSGSLFAVGGSAWSGVPDDVRPDPESRWATNSSTFRMITRYDDFRDVRVEFALTNRGAVAPDLAAQSPPPSPGPYPTGTGPVVATRLDGRSNVHVAIAASQRAFARGAPQAVVVASPIGPESLAAPALAGTVGGPVLVTEAASLHRDTAEELRRLGARRIHLVGGFADGVVAALTAGDVEVVRHDGGNVEEVTAQVARAIGGSRVFLATTDRWADAVPISGVAAARRQPVVLTPASRLGPAAAASIRHLDAREITVLGNDLAPGVVAGLRAEGRRVTYAGHGRSSIARVAAEMQQAAGRSAARVWVAAGSRPFHVLAAGPAADTAGAVLLVVNGDDLGDVSLDDLAYRGYEARHWGRRHRRDLRAIVAVGSTDAVSDRVLAQLRAEQVTVIAGFRDIAGTTHQHAIVQLVEQHITGGYPDGTYRPGEVVTRGQMATFLTRAWSLPTGTARFLDTAGTTHEAAIASVTGAGIASGHPDGTYRPNAPVTRGQMATFLSRTLSLPPASPDFTDVAETTHATAIGAVAATGIAGGYPDGSYRPDDPVTRGQLAAFLTRAMEADARG